MQKISRWFHGERLSNIGKVYCVGPKEKDSVPVECLQVPTVFAVLREARKIMCIHVGLRNILSRVHHRPQRIATKSQARSEECPCPRIAEDKYQRVDCRARDALRRGRCEGVCHDSTLHYLWQGKCSTCKFCTDCVWAGRPN